MGVSHAVTLDLWRTLVIEGPPAYPGSAGSRNHARVAGVLNALAAAGHPTDRSALEAAFERVRDDMDHAHHNGVDRTFQLWVRQIIEYVEPGRFDRLDRDSADAVTRAVDETFLVHPPMPHPAATQVLEKLAKKNLRIGLISNTGFTSGDTYRQWFQRLGWLGFFHAITFSNEAVIAKPAAGIFLSTLEELGSTPSLALHVGDSHHSDMAGARAVGMSTAWISGFDDSEPEAPPDYSLGDLSELPAAVDKWLANE